MAQIDVTTDAVQLPIADDARPSIWNEGPGRLWLARTEADATPGEGWPVDAGKGYEWPTDLNGRLFASSESTSDVRIMVVG